jgi:hypothetical protein
VSPLFGYIVPSWSVCMARIGLAAQGAVRAG